MRFQIDNPAITPIYFGANPPYYRWVAANSLVTDLQPGDAIFLITVKQVADYYAYTITPPGDWTIDALYTWHDANIRTSGPIGFGTGTRFTLGFYHRIWTDADDQASYYAEWSYNFIEGIVTFTPIVGQAVQTVNAFDSDQYGPLTPDSYTEAMPLEPGATALLTAHADYTPLWTLATWQLGPDNTDLCYSTMPGSGNWDGPPTLPDGYNVDMNIYPPPDLFYTFHDIGLSDGPIAASFGTGGLHIWEHVGPRT